MSDAEAISRISLEKIYKQEKKTMEAVLTNMVKLIQEKISLEGMFPAYKSRLKSFQSFFSKKIKFARDATIQGSVPLPISDILAVRIICPFISDIEKIEKILSENFIIREIERKGLDRSFKEFGYESIHLLLVIPEDMLAGISFINPPVCEVQIRTILQDAWAEVEHELVYKAEFTPFDDPMKRKLAALNANLTLSDMLFQEIRDYQHQLSNELAKRRVAFFKKIENSIDNEMYKNIKAEDKKADPGSSQPAWLESLKSLDDLLLEALNAHNRADYLRAINIYSYILSLDPKADIKTLIFKHRGMAYFSESKYDEALNDFSSALEMDGKCYKAAYYRGVVHSVKQNYASAVDDFSRALLLHPYHFYSIYRRAQAYFHIEDYPMALADCDTAMELDPYNEGLKKLKALVMKKLRM